MASINNIDSYTKNYYTDNTTNKLSTNKSVDKQSTTTDMTPDVALSNKVTIAKTNLDNKNVVSSNEEQNQKMQEEQAQKNRQRVQEILDKVSVKDLGLSFKVDEDINKTLISVTDLQTEDVVRQIPSEEFVKMARAIKEFSNSQEDVVRKDQSQTKNTNLKGLILDDMA